MGNLLTQLTDVYAGHRHLGTYKPVLNGISLDVAAGDRIAILGGSGAGKTTLMRVLDGHLQPDRGTVTWPQGRPRHGISLQDPLLFDWLTVAQNVEVGRRFTAHRDRSADIDELKTALGLGPLWQAWPDQLSGGQAQRTSLARALATDPEVLLLDEPLSALDPATRHQVQVWLRGWLKQRDTAVVLVTHDISEALTLADTVFLLGSGGTFTEKWSVPAEESKREKLWTQIRAAYDEPDDDQFEELPDLEAAHA